MMNSYRTHRTYYTYRTYYTLTYSQGVFSMKKQNTLKNGGVSRLGLSGLSRLSVLSGLSRLSGFSVLSGSSSLPNPPNLNLLKRGIFCEKLDRTHCFSILPSQAGNLQTM